MNKIAIAIGGGNLGKKETVQIDKKMMELSRKKAPKILFFPTATKDDQGYAKRFKKYYRSLGCEVDALRLMHTKKTREEVMALMNTYDIIYLGGGDTQLLMDTIMDWGLKDTFYKLYQQGVILAGISAGANVLFTYGYSDSKKEYQFIKGMGLIEGVFTPHYQKRTCFDEVSKYFKMKRITCNDGQAFIIEEGNGYFYPYEEN